jgi:hypothetical protein
MELFPVLKDNFPELRKWTVRSRPPANGSPQIAAAPHLSEADQPHHSTREAVLKLPPEMTQRPF